MTIAPPPHPRPSNLISVTMTQFVNFVVKDGPGQLTAVRAIKKQHHEGYKVPPGHYKQFRDAIVAAHRDGRGLEHLDRVAASQTEPARVQTYPVLVAGYRIFVGRRKVEWLDPPKGAWQYGGLEVGIRPELGLVITHPRGAERLLIKMHLSKPDKDGESIMNKRRAMIVTHLMRLAIPGLDEGIIPAVLDVRRGKVFRAEPADPEQTVLLRGQARAFVEIYRGL